MNSIRSLLFLTDIRTSLPAMPNGNLVYDVNVTSIDLGFDISFTTASCGHDFPLLGIKGATVLFGSPEPGSDVVVYGHEDFTPGTNIAVGRIVSATKPVTGIFELELDGKSVTGKFLRSIYSRGKMEEEGDWNE